MARPRRKRSSYKQPQVYDSSFKDWISQQAQDILPLLVTGVNNPQAFARGLCLSSTAIRHTVAGVQLWLHRLTHQGTLTRCPCLSSLAGQATFAS